MSELKAFDITVAEEGYCEGIVKYRRHVYDKYEADKVIAELKKKLEDTISSASITCEAVRRCNEEIRHSNYKRCLAMVRMLEYMFCPVTDCKENWRVKWRKRWLELAEKFKPNKE